MFKNALFKSMILAVGAAVACESNAVSPNAKSECNSSTYCPIRVREHSKLSVIKNLESMIEFYRDNESPNVRGLNKSIPLDTTAEVDQEEIRSIQEALVFHGYLNYARNGELDTETIDAINVYRRVNALPGSDRIDSNFISHISTSSGVRVKLLEEVLNVVKPMDTKNSVLVNLPEYKLRYYNDDKLAFEMELGIGNTKDSMKWVTNVQRGVLKEVVVNPWYVAGSKTMIPEMANDLRNSSRLRKSTEQYVNGRWIPVEGNDLVGTMFRQWPSDANLYGHVLYDFNGGYGEAIHGTPYKSVFKKNIRAVSHGCMRLAEESGLMRAFQIVGLVSEDVNLDELLNAKEGDRYKTRYLKLSEPIGVHIAYLRAWVEEGSYGLRMIMPPDVYNYKNSRFR